MESYGNYTLDMLISEHRNGNEDAFVELVHRFEPMIQKAALSLSLDVREVYSEACLSIRRAADSFVTGGKVTFGLYAKICVTRAMLDFVKRGKGAEVVSDFSIDDVAVSDGVQKRLEREESLAAFVSRARVLLSDLEYEVFNLAMRGYSVSEMVEILNKSAKSLENAKARMQKKLRTGVGQIPEI